MFFLDMELDMASFWSERKNISVKEHNIELALTQNRKYQRSNRNCLNCSNTPRPVCTLELWQLTFEGLQKFRRVRTRRDHLVTTRRDPHDPHPRPAVTNRQKLASSGLFQLKWTEVKACQYLFFFF